MQGYWSPTFQNDLGLDILKVPQVIRQSMYAPRDPALKDNWRGRGRQDLCNVEVTQVRDLTFLYAWQLAMIVGILYVVCTIGSISLMT